MDRAEFIKIYLENQAIIDKARAEIIKDALDAEGFLNAILTSYFIDDDEKSRLFSRSVLGKEFFTFSAKIKLFSTTNLHRQEKYGDKFKGLTGKLMDIMETRNIVAHNVSMAHTPEIWYTDNEGKDKLLSLADDGLNKFRKVYNECMRALDEIFVDTINDKKEKRSNSS